MASGIIEKLLYYRDGSEVRYVYCADCRHLILREELSNEKAKD